LIEGKPPYFELKPQKAILDIVISGFPGYLYVDQHSKMFKYFVSKCVSFYPK
jgi:hypothetical protein